LKTYFALIREPAKKTAEETNDTKAGAKVSDTKESEKTPRKELAQKKKEDVCVEPSQELRESEQMAVESPEPAPVVASPLKTPSVTIPAVTEPPAQPSITETPSMIYFCRKCRTKLFTSLDIVPHEVGEGQAAFDWKKRDASKVYAKQKKKKKRKENITAYFFIFYFFLIDHFSCSDSSQRECSSLFLDHMEWMGDCLDVQGKLECPKCKSKLGTWKWDGDQCSCG
jgi:hypothetical protein